MSLQHLQDQPSSRRVALEPERALPLLLEQANAAASQSAWRWVVAHTLLSDFRSLSVGSAFVRLLAGHNSTAAHALIVPCERVLTSANERQASIVVCFELEADLDPGAARLKMTLRDLCRGYSLVLFGDLLWRADWEVCYGTGYETGHGTGYGTGYGATYTDLGGTLTVCEQRRHKHSGYPWRDLVAAAAPKKPKKQRESSHIRSNAWTLPTVRFDDWPFNFVSSGQAPQHTTKSAVQWERLGG